MSIRKVPLFECCLGTPTPWYKRWWCEIKFRWNGCWSFAGYEPLKNWNRLLCFDCYRKHGCPDIWKMSLITTKGKPSSMLCCVTDALYTAWEKGPPLECPYQMEHIILAGLETKVKDNADVSG